MESTDTKIVAPTTVPTKINVLDYLIVCIQLSEVAGKIIRELAESGGYKKAMQKSNMSLKHIFMLIL